MTRNTVHFDDAAAYERFMGRWSRAAGSAFLDWVAPPAGVRWLEVGCGSGAFTELVLDRCRPSMISAVDPAKAQIDYVSAGPSAGRAVFLVADAQGLPFPDATFGVVASALVINFIPDRPRGLKEMRRVARPGGMVTGYVWDFAGDRGPNQPVRTGMLRIGAEVQRQSGAEGTSLAALNSLFEQTGFEEIATKAIDVSLDFPTFEDYWRAQTPPLHPIARTIAALPETDRVKLADLVRAELGTRSNGGITCAARANAIKARVPSYSANRL